MKNNAISSGAPDIQVVIEQLAEMNRSIGRVESRIKDLSAWQSLVENWLSRIDARYKSKSIAFKCGYSAGRIFGYLGKSLRSENAQ